MIRSQYLRSFERHAPYCTMASYLPVSATIGEQASAPQSGALPWFRGTWAANGPPSVDGAEPILGNRRFREAASRLFDGAEVMPTTIVINVNAPMPAGAIHVNILPSEARLVTVIRSNCFKRWEVQGCLSRGATSKRERSLGFMKAQAANSTTGPRV